MTKETEMTFETWYDRSIRLWTTIQNDAEGFQVGHAGYAMTKSESVEDCKYQNQEDDNGN